MVRPRPLPALLAGMLLASALLAGCTGGREDAGDDGSEGVPRDVDPLPRENRTALEGTVRDAASQPIEGAFVTLQASAGQEQTGPEGRYSFVNLTPNQQYILFASKQGFVSVSKQALLVEGQVTVVDFTLEAEPPADAYLAPQEWTGFLSCHGYARVGGDPHAGDNGTEEEVACGDADPNQERRHEFALDPGAKGALFEVRWTEQTPLAHNLHVVIEGVGFGDSDPVIGEGDGASVIQIAIAQVVLEKYFSEGGRISVDVSPHGSLAGEEAGSDVGFTVAQSFDTVLTASYGGPLPSGYTAFGESA